MSGTAKSAHTDPDIQAEWDRATRELDRRLRPHMLEHTAWNLARQFLLDMATQGFRPPLRPPRPQQTAAPPSGTNLPAEYLATKAAITRDQEQP